MSAKIARSIIRDVVADKVWWTTTYRPGDTVPVSGIYRCIVCGREDACNENDPFPPQNHTQHPQGRGVEWQLNVRAEQTPV